MSVDLPLWRCHLNMAGMRVFTMASLLLQSCNLSLITSVACVSGFFFVCQIIFHLIEMPRIISLICELIDIGAFMTDVFRKL